MTLIAYSTNFKIPFIVGDLLLSSGKKTLFMPPTFTCDVSALVTEPGKTSFPNDMAQKIYIVTPHLIVALAGNVTQMTDFLKELKIRCRYYDNLRPEHIHTFLQGYELLKNFCEAAFFMVLINHEENNKLKASLFHSGEWQGLNTPIFNDLSSIGTGSTSFNQWASEDITFTTTANHGEPAYALYSNIGQVARLLGIEWATLATIKKSWGAGYEIAFYTGKQFIKIDEIIYLIFECSYDDAGNISDPVLAKAMYYFYYEDILRIISLDILKGESKGNGSSLEINGYEIGLGTYDIPSLDIPIEQSSDNLPDDLSFYTRRIAAAVVAVKKETNVFVCSFFNEGSDGFAEFKSGESFTVSLPADTIDKVRAGAKNAYPII